MPGYPCCCAGGGTVDIITRLSGDEDDTVRWTLSSSGQAVVWDSALIADPWSGNSLAIAPSFLGDAVYINTVSDGLYVFDVAAGADSLLTTINGTVTEINQESDGFVCTDSWDGSAANDTITSYATGGSATDFVIGTGTRASWALRIDNTLYYYRGGLNKIDVGGSPSSVGVASGSKIVSDGVDMIFSLTSAGGGEWNVVGVDITGPSSSTLATTSGSSGTPDALTFLNGKLYWLTHDGASTNWHYTQVWRYDPSSDVLSLILEGDWTDISKDDHNLFVVADNT